MCAHRFFEDRFWCQQDLTSRELSIVNGTLPSDVVARNTSTTKLQDNVFYFHASVSGRVFGDGNADGLSNRGENGIAGVAVQLLDANGSAIAATVTAGDGSYRFDHLDLGQYQVRVALPRGAQTTTPAIQEVHITRGGAMAPSDVALRPEAPSNLSNDHVHAAWNGRGALHASPRCRRQTTRFSRNTGSEYRAEE